MSRGHFTGSALLLDHSGQRALYLPAAEAADFQGATLTWRSCAGDKREGCPLRNHPALYFRAWLRLAEERGAEIRVVGPGDSAARSQTWNERILEAVDFVRKAAGRRP